MKLNEDQQNAIAEMQDFILSSDEQFFLLEGPAGTGKTTCVKELIRLITGKIVFTAPTNKAVRVLRDTLRTPEYDPICCTIYSLLGLRMEPNGEIKLLSNPEPDSVDLSGYKLVVVDEGYMLNSQVWRYIRHAADSGIKFIFMGDACQLPPVGEPVSLTAKIENKAQLTKIERFDNQLLKLSSYLRECQEPPITKAVRIKDDHDEEGGVVKVSQSEFYRMIADYAGQGLFSQPGYCKALAWRNQTVNIMNSLIRRKIFESQATWLVGERVVIAKPVTGFDGEKLCSTDDEGTVTAVLVSPHPVYNGIVCYHLYVTLDGSNKQVLIYSVHETSFMAFSERKNLLSQKAKVATNRRKAWEEFWAFVDSFADVRYGYAITVHRSQGSTYDEVFVDSNDILTNREPRERLQCLYVAATRARKRAIIC